MTTHHQLEKDAELAGAAVAGGLSAIDIAAIGLLVLLVCPPLAILAFVVIAPLFVAALAVGLLVFILSMPYLLVHHFRAGHGDHMSLLWQRIRHAAGAIVDLAPHRIVADVRKARPHR